MPLQALADASPDAGAEGEMGGVEAIVDGAAIGAVRILTKDEQPYCVCHTLSNMVLLPAAAHPSYLSSRVPGFQVDNPVLQGASDSASKGDHNW